MIRNFHVLYVGQIELDNVGLSGTPANERRYSDERLREAFATARDVAQHMDRLCFRVVVAAQPPLPRHGSEWPSHITSSARATSACPTSSSSDYGSPRSPSASSSAAPSTSCRCGIPSASPKTTP